jgi:hypothetical protein
MAKTEKPAHDRQCQYGTIKDDEAYTIQEFSKRTGFREWALRSLRNKGLPMIKVSGRCFIRGRDFLQFLDQEAHRDGAQIAV